MKKSKIFTTLLLIIAMAFTAKAQEEFTPNTLWPYVYENFESGTIYFANEKQNSSLLNIHLYGNVLHYVANDGKIYNVDVKDITKVAIGNDTYVCNNGKMMQVVAAKGGATLLKMEKADFDALFTSTGAYGASLNTYGSRDISALDLGGLNGPELGKMMQTKKDGREISIKAEYYLKIGSKLMPANKKDIINNLDESIKGDFKTYVDKNKIKWKKENSLVKMMDFFDK